MTGAEPPRVPAGLRDLMKSLTKEVLREKPPDIYEFSAQYFETMLEEKRDSESTEYEPPTSYEAIFRNRERNQMPLALVYSIIPSGLTELIKEFIKAVLRANPPNLCAFAVAYFRGLQRAKDGVCCMEYTAYENYFKGKERFSFSPYVKCTCGRTLGEGVLSNSAQFEKNVSTTTTTSMHYSSTTKTTESWESRQDVVIANGQGVTGKEAPEKSVTEDEKSKAGEGDLGRREHSEKVQSTSVKYEEDEYLRAIFIIQRFFRRALKFKKLKSSAPDHIVTKDESIGEVSTTKRSQMSETTAALIIQRTLRSLFTARQQQLKTVYVPRLENLQQKDDQYDNASEANSYTSASTALLSAESQPMSSPGTNYDEEIIQKTIHEANESEANEENYIKDINNMVAISEQGSKDGIMNSMEPLSSNLEDTQLIKDEKVTDEAQIQSKTELKEVGVAGNGIEVREANDVGTVAVPTEEKKATSIDEEGATTEHEVEAAKLAAKDILTKAIEDGPVTDQTSESAHKGEGGTKGEIDGSDKDDIDKNTGSKETPATATQASKSEDSKDVSGDKQHNESKLLEEDKEKQRDRRRSINEEHEKQSLQALLAGAKTSTKPKHKSQTASKDEVDEVLKYVVVEKQILADTENKEDAKESDEVITKQAAEIMAEQGEKKDDLIGDSEIHRNKRDTESATEGGESNVKKADDESDANNTTKVELVEDANGTIVQAKQDEEEQRNSNKGVEEFVSTGNDKLSPESTARMSNETVNVAEHIESVASDVASKKDHESPEAVSISVKSTGSIEGVQASAEEQLKEDSERDVKVSSPSAKQSSAEEQSKEDSGQNIKVSSESAKQSSAEERSKEDSEQDVKDASESVKQSSAEEQLKEDSGQDIKVSLESVKQSSAEEQSKEDSEQDVKVSSPSAKQSSAEEQSKEDSEQDVKDASESVKQSSAEEQSKEDSEQDVKDASESVKQSSAEEQLKEDSGRDIKVSSESVKQSSAEEQSKEDSEQDVKVSSPLIKQSSAEEQSKEDSGRDIKVSPESGKESSVEEQPKEDSGQDVKVSALSPKQLGEENEGKNTVTAKDEFDTIKTKGVELVANAATTALLVEQVDVEQKNEENRDELTSTEIISEKGINKIVENDVISDEKLENQEAAFISDEADPSQDKSNTDNTHEEDAAPAKGVSVEPLSQSEANVNLNELEAKSKNDTMAETSTLKEKAIEPLLEAHAKTEDETITIPATPVVSSEVHITPDLQQMDKEVELSREGVQDAEKEHAGDEARNAATSDNKKDMETEDQDIEIDDDSEKTISETNGSNDNTSAQSQNQPLDSSEAIPAESISLTSDDVTKDATQKSHSLVDDADIKSIEKSATENIVIEPIVPKEKDAVDQLMDTNRPAVENSECAEPGGVIKEIDAGAKVDGVVVDSLKAADEASDTKYDEEMQSKPHSQATGANLSGEGDVQTADQLIKSTVDGSEIVEANKDIETNEATKKETDVVLASLKATDEGGVSKKDEEMQSALPTSAADTNLSAGIDERTGAAYSALQDDLAQSAQAPAEKGALLSTEDATIKAGEGDDTNKKVSSEQTESARDELSDVLDEVHEDKSIVKADSTSIESAAIELSPEQETAQKEGVNPVDDSKPIINSEIEGLEATRVKTPTATEGAPPAETEKELHSEQPTEHKDPKQNAAAETAPSSSAESQLTRDESVKDQEDSTIHSIDDSSGKVTHDEEATVVTSAETIREESEKPTGNGTTSNESTANEAATANQEARDSQENAASPAEQLEKHESTIETVKQSSDISPNETVNVSLPSKDAIEATDADVNTSPNLTTAPQPTTAPIIGTQNSQQMPPSKEVKQELSSEQQIENQNSQTQSNITNSTKNNNNNNNNNNKQTKKFRNEPIGRDPLIAEIHLKSFKLPDHLEAIPWYEALASKEYYSDGLDESQKKVTKSPEIDFQAAPTKKEISKTHDAHVEVPKEHKEQNAEKVEVKESKSATLENNEYIEKQSAIVSENIPQNEVQPPLGESSTTKERAPKYLYGHTMQHEANLPREAVKPATAFTIPLDNVPKKKPNLLSARESKAESSHDGETVEAKRKGTKVNMPKLLVVTPNNDEEKQIELESPTKLFAELNAFEEAVVDPSLDVTYTAAEASQLLDLRGLSKGDLALSEDAMSSTSSSDKMLQTIEEGNESETPRPESGRHGQPSFTPNLTAIELEKNERNKRSLNIEEVSKVEKEDSTGDQSVALRKSQDEIIEPSAPPMEALEPDNTKITVSRQMASSPKNRVGKKAEPVTSLEQQFEALVRSAIIIQKAFRAYMIKLKSEPLTKKKEDISSSAEVIRPESVSKNEADVKTAKPGVQQHDEVLSVQSLVHAAIIIQKAFRTYMVKRKSQLPMKRNEDVSISAEINNLEASIEAEKEVKGVERHGEMSSVQSLVRPAIIIQKAFRGYLTRKQSVAKPQNSATPTSALENTQASDEINLSKTYSILETAPSRGIDEENHAEVDALLATLPSPATSELSSTDTEDSLKPTNIQDFIELVRAAVIIQKTFRGYLARRNVKRNSSQMHLKQEAEIAIKPKDELEVVTGKDLLETSKDETQVDVPVVTVTGSPTEAQLPPDLPSSAHGRRARSTAKSDAIKTAPEVRSAAALVIQTAFRDYLARRISRKSQNSLLSSENFSNESQITEINVADRERLKNLSHVTSTEDIEDIKDYLATPDASHGAGSNDVFEYPAADDNSKVQWFVGNEPITPSDQQMTKTYVLNDTNDLASLTNTNTNNSRVTADDDANANADANVANASISNDELAQLAANVVDSSSNLLQSVATQSIDKENSNNNDNNNNLSLTGAIVSAVEGGEASEATAVVEGAADEKLPVNGSVAEAEKNSGSAAATASTEQLSAVENAIQHPEDAFIAAAAVESTLAAPAVHLPHLVGEFLHTERVYCNTDKEPAKLSQAKRGDDDINYDIITELLNKTVDSDIPYAPLEEPLCIKKTVSTTHIDGDEELAEHTALSDAEPNFIEDTLQRTNEKLAEADKVIEKMQLRRASTARTDSAEPTREPSFDAPAVSAQPLRTPDTEEEGEDVVLQRLQRQDTRESSATSDVVIFGGEGEIEGSVEGAPEVEDLAMLKTSLKRVHTIAGDDAQSLYKSVTIGETTEYIVPPESETTITSEGSFSLDDTVTDTIREKMLAYSLSEGDSDYYEAAEAGKSSEKDDFNINTALVDNGESSTETESTIVSAATKIQAGARGFLTRRRLRRVSATKSGSTAPEAPDYKASFGNDAINESLERLVEDEAAKKIQTAYRNHYRRRQKKLPRSAKARTAGSGTHAYQAQDFRQAASLESSLAARRQTLQRAVAMQNDSTPEEERSSKEEQHKSPNGEREQRSSSMTQTRRSSLLVVGTTKTTTTKETSSKTVTATSTSTTIATTTNTSSAANERAKRINANKLKWLAIRQNSMPVQIDSQVLRILPRHANKRIKSAEGDEQQQQKQKLLKKKQQHSKHGILK